MDKDILLVMILSLDMGFSEREVREALKYNSTQESAVSWLFEQREKGFSIGSSSQPSSGNVDLEAIKKQHQFSYDSLNIMVKEYGFNVIPVDHDGNCLFECLKRGYQKQAEKYGKKMGSQEEIRNAIFLHLQKHKDDYVYYVENWEDFCTKLLTNGEWGGEVEIMCFARTFQVNIHVHQITNYESLTIRAEYKEGRYNIHLAHVNDLNPLENFGRNHYVLLDPLFENPAYSPEMVAMTDEEKRLAEEDFGLQEEDIEPAEGFNTPEPSAPPPEKHPNANPIEGINILADIKKHDESPDIGTSGHSILDDIRIAALEEPKVKNGSILDELSKTSEEPEVKQGSILDELTTTSEQPDINRGSILDDIAKPIDPDFASGSTSILNEVKDAVTPDHDIKSSILDDIQPPVSLLDSAEPNIIEENALSQAVDPMGGSDSILADISEPEPLLSEETMNTNILSDVPQDSPPIVDLEPNLAEQIPSQSPLIQNEENILQQIPDIDKKPNFKDERRTSIVEEIGPVEPILDKINTDLPDALEEAAKSEPLHSQIKKDLPQALIDAKQEQEEALHKKIKAISKALNDVDKSDVPRENILDTIDLSSKEPDVARSSILDEIPIEKDLLNSSDRRNIVEMMSENKRDPTMLLSADPIEISPAVQQPVAPPMIKEPSDGEWEQVKVDEDVAKVGKIFRKDPEEDEDWVAIDADN